MMNTIVIFGLSSIIGVYIGGGISDLIGIGNVFMGAAFVCFFAVCIFALAGRKHDFTANGNE